MTGRRPSRRCHPQPQHRGLDSAPQPNLRQQHTFDFEGLQCRVCVVSRLHGCASEPTQPWSTQRTAQRAAQRVAVTASQYLMPCWLNSLTRSRRARSNAACATVRSALHAASRPGRSRTRTRLTSHQLDAGATVSANQATPPPSSPPPSSVHNFLIFSTKPIISSTQ